MFQSKLEEFKKAHNSNFPSITIKGNYLVDNEYPIGENDKQQYFRCLAYDVKIGNNSLVCEVEGVKRKFTIIEGYSRNDENKKRAYARSNSSKKFKSLTKSKKNLDVRGKKKPKF